MVREHLGVILGPAEPLDPLSGEPMLLGSSRTRDLAVGDISDEQVPERVFALARDRRPALATHELLALEPVQGLLGRRAVPRRRSRAAAPSQNTLPSTAAS